MLRTRQSLAVAALFAALATPLIAQDATRWTLPDKPGATVVTSEHLQGVITVKFAHDSGVRVSGNRFAAAATDVEGVNEVLETLGGSARKIFLQSEETLDAWRANGELRTGKKLHDLNLFMFVDVEPARAGALCDALNEFEAVELAYPASSGGDPVFTPLPAPTPVSPLLGGTPDYEPNQRYRRNAPVGVGADDANTFSGGRGLDVLVIDCETAWTDDHEDLVHKLEDQFVGSLPANYPWDHGTAVMGEILGGDNGFGVKGIAFEAEGKMSTHSPVGGGLNIPASIANAAAVAVAGDVIVVEIQCFGPFPGPHPCEGDPVNFATIETATANGVHVYAAAGNGSFDLDGPAFGDAFDLNVKDSGAVLVGATDGASLITADFSNFGSRVTSNGWGRDVTTTAYGDLQGGPATQHYTKQFSGTSSATPIVTGAAAILIAMHREAFGFEIDPLVLRDLLATTGTPQVAGGAIGTRPDLSKAIRELQLPEIRITQDTGPGGILEITSYGRPNDTYSLLWSVNLLADPLHVAPWGQLFLDPFSVVILVSGTLDASGQSVDTFPLPMMTGISGETTYFQGLQDFTNSGMSGTGSLANVVPFVVP